MEHGLHRVRRARDGPLVPRDRNEDAGATMSTSVAVAPTVRSPSMDMLMDDAIAEARLTDWRKLAQGLHARYLVDDFGAGARFVAAVGEAGDALSPDPPIGGWV